MSEFTDKNIPIECGECAHLEEGVISMQIHVALTHSDIYNDKEIIKTVRKWADDAYEADDEREMKATLYARGK